MSGRRFEDEVAWWLGQAGYRQVVKTEYYDMGVDLIARKDGIKYAVQVKRYKDPVGVSAVRAVVAGMVMYGCERSMVITNATFTKQAQRLAMANHCLLVDGDGLRDGLKKH